MSIVYLLLTIVFGTSLGVNVHALNKSDDNCKTQLEQDVHLYTIVLLIIMTSISAIATFFSLVGKDKNTGGSPVNKFSF